MNSRHRKTDDPIVKRLHSVVDCSPDLRVAARLYETILPLVRDADIHVSLQRLDQSMVRACLASGVPVLCGIGLEVEFRGVDELMLQLVRAVESMAASEKSGCGWKIWQRTSHPQAPDDQAACRSLNAMAATIRTAIEDKRLDLDELLGFAASGDYEGLAGKAGTLQLAPGLLRTLAQNALKPALNICRQDIVPLAAGVPWDSGICYICGCKATLAELQDNDQVKHLRCGQCGADWRFNRLQCLHCGNMEHTTQQTFSIDGCDNRRIEACDECGGYLKVITSFVPTPPELLAVEDLATLHLDFIARQRGYTRDGLAYSA